ncbi:MAG: (2Fe-2S)-binding protein [SAR324 cluster bacterium]|nr:(2Fe-2S)-binding protein [SAR324 cluster bacterium]
MKPEKTVTITLNVNNENYTLTVKPQRLLMDCLRYDLGLTGTKEACGIGVCGVCTIMLDGKIVSSCLKFAVQADGKKITTIEGLATGEQLDPVQQAFIDHGGFQCGICTPGMVMSAKALLEKNPDPNESEIKEWMSGNLCRCTGYYGIINSIKAAASILKTESSL